MPIHQYWTGTDPGCAGPRANGRVEPQPTTAGHVIADLVADARLAAHYPTEVVAAGALRFALLSSPAMPVVVNESTGRLVTSGRVDREAICAAASGVTSSAPTCRVRLDVAVHPVQYFRIGRIGRIGVSGGHVQPVQYFRIGGKGRMGVSGGHFHPVQYFRIGGIGRVGVSGGRVHPVQYFRIGGIGRMGVSGGHFHPVQYFRIGRVGVSGGRVHPVQYFRIVKVSVDVADINDNGPVFVPAAIVRDVSEAAPAGSGFVIPTAHDADTARGYLPGRTTPTRPSSAWPGTC